MTSALRLSCAVCHQGATLRPFNGESLGEAAYRAGWRARCDRPGYRWSQYCPKHAPKLPAPPTEPEDEPFV
jgi:hypothetical protein